VREAALLGQMTKISPGRFQKTSFRKINRERMGAKSSIKEGFSITATTDGKDSFRNPLQK
jgi:hypothetical protein